VSLDTRPLSIVPRWVWVGFFGLLALQLLVRSAERTGPPRAEDLPPAPRPVALRLAGFGEPEAAARVAMLYVQSFDMAGGGDTPYRSLDYSRLLGWLRAILTVDPRSEYPLFAAARVYAEVPDPARSRLALEFLYEEFLKDPNRRWRWLAHAALLAKHRLNDPTLALHYAATIERLATAETIPLWARQMRIFILEDLNELEAARIMIGGLLAGGHIHDPAEAGFLKRRLEDLSARIDRDRQDRGKPPPGRASKN